MVICPLFTATVCEENTAMFPAQECVINCQRLESNELKSSRNTNENPPVDDELEELLDDELEELLLDDELDELELELLEDELLEDELLDDELLLEDELLELLDEELPVPPLQDPAAGLIPLTSKLSIFGSPALLLALTLSKLLPACKLTVTEGVKAHVVHEPVPAKLRLATVFPFTKRLAERALEAFA
jgi:hypothetical protein